MDEVMLRDPERFPDEEVLRKTLGKSFEAYSELIKSLAKPEFQIGGDWRYYKDGRAWLKKSVRKDKTVFWLSVWDGYFKTGFYFTEKNSGGINDLRINEKIKREFANAPPIGKLLPLTIEVRSVEDVNSVLEVAKYKLSVK